MFSQHGDPNGNRRPFVARGLMLASLALLVVAAVQPVRAQTFNSGSTGADGAFAPTADATVQVPDSGVFNYTTVTILASGNVSIIGTITVDGRGGNESGGGGQGGPGGFDGGSGGTFYAINGGAGDGPGAGGGGVGSGRVGGGAGFAVEGTVGSSDGQAGSGVGGARYSAKTLLPLIGGSGGGGGASGNENGGAGGGGAILIASSSTITGTGSINARGGGGVNRCGGGGAGAPGAGGAVRLIANTISGSFVARVGAGGQPGCNSGRFSGGSSPGYVRIETFDNSGFTGSASPNQISYALPFPVTLPNAPSLRITSVGGVQAPSQPVGSLRGAPDVVIPATLANPVTIALAASNIPVGTVVQVTLIPESGARQTANSTALAGSEATSTASANIAVPSGLSVISAAVTIELAPQGASMQPPVFMEGERVKRIEVAATFGQASTITYVTQSGRRITKIAD